MKIDLTQHTLSPLSLSTLLALLILRGDSAEIIHYEKALTESDLTPLSEKLEKAICRLSAVQVFERKAGDDSIRINPASIDCKKLKVDLENQPWGNAFLQATLLLAVCNSRKIELQLKGLCDPLRAPSLDHLLAFLVPHLSVLADIDFHWSKRGYYPKGGGELEITVNPKVPRAGFESFSKFLATFRSNVNASFLLSKREISCVKGLSHASSDLKKRKVVERQVRAARQALYEEYADVKFERQYAAAKSPGSSVLLIAEYAEDSFPLLTCVERRGELHLAAEKVGKEAATLLQERLSFEKPSLFELELLFPLLLLFGADVAPLMAELTSESELYRECLRLFQHD